MDPKSNDKCPIRDKKREVTERQKRRRQCNGEGAAETGMIQL